MPNEQFADEGETREEALVSGFERLAESSGEAAAHCRAGWLLGQQERYTEAVSHLAVAVEIDPQNADAWYLLGMSVSRVSGVDAVRAVAERYERLAPEDAIGLTRRANLWREANDPQKGLIYARRARSVTADPQELAWIHRVIARCYEVLGDVASRTRELEVAVEHDPRNGRTIAELAYLQEQQGQPVTVFRLAEELVTQEPGNPEAWYALGAVANRSGDWWTAKSALEKALALGYTPASGRRELGAALCELGSYREAVSELEMALQAEPDAARQVWIHSRLGYSYRQLKNFQKTLEHYRAAVETAPSNAHAQQGLGASYIELHDFDAGLSHLTEATRLAPDEAEPWYALGRALAWTGDLGGAEAALGKAVALGFPDGKARAQLAWVYQRQNRPQAAAEQAKRALRRSVPKKWRSWVAGIIADGGKPRRHRMTLPG
jgi:tetratricopeptide (TPR) repeat protein